MLLIKIFSGLYEEVVVEPGELWLKPLLRYETQDHITTATEAL